MFLLCIIECFNYDFEAWLCHAKCARARVVCTICIHSVWCYSDSVFSNWMFSCLYNLNGPKRYWAFNLSSMATTTTAIIKIPPFMKPFSSMKMITMPSGLVYAEELSRYYVKMFAAFQTIDLINYNSRRKWKGVSGWSSILRWWCEDVGTFAYIVSDLTGTWQICEYIQNNFHFIKLQSVDDARLFEKVLRLQLFLASQYIFLYFFFHPLWISIFRLTLYAFLSQWQMK